MDGTPPAQQTNFFKKKFRAAYSRIEGLSLIVLDASIVVELLINGRSSNMVKRHLAAHNDFFIVPHLLDVEVASAFRKLNAGRRLDSQLMLHLLTELAALPAERYAHTPLLPRIWQLRHNFTCYDATYIALAEATNSILYTSDQKLSKGHRARVEVWNLIM